MNNTQERSSQKQRSASVEFRGSDAFDPKEYVRQMSDAAIHDDIISYLGEYRFQLSKYEYKYSITNGELCDINDGVSMKTKTVRAIEKRRSAGKSTNREEAELRGFGRIEEQLETAKADDTLFWASPPGAKTDGYGEYGFLFVGKVKKTGKELTMTAIRVENPTIEQYNHALSFLTVQESNHKTAEDFLKDPIMIHADVFEHVIDKTLAGIFSFDVDDSQMQKFKRIVAKLDPLIAECIPILRYGTKQKQIEAIYTLENYALALKRKESVIKDEHVVYESLPRLTQLADRYGHTPPAVGGSCGSTKSNDKTSLSSANIFNRGNILFALGLFDEDSYDFDQPGPCKKCGADAKCGPCGICRPCDAILRKESEFGAVEETAMAA